MRHIQSVPYHPAANRATEHVVQTFKQAIRASEGSSLSLQHRLDNVLLSYRTTPHSTTGETPSLLLLGRQVRTRFDLLRPDRERWVCAKQACQKMGHDNKAKDGELHIGELILDRDWRDSHIQWKPGVVAERRGPLSYLVQMDSVQCWQRHIEHLRSIRGVDPFCSLPDDNSVGLSMSQDSTVEIPTSLPRSLIIPSSVQMDEDKSQMRDVPGNTDLPV